MLIDRKDVPKHLFGIPELDLSGDLCAEPLSGQWFRLGAWTFGSGSDGQGVEHAVYRQSMLSPGDFAGIFDELDSPLVGIGKPGGSLKTEGDKTVYCYAPFHRFEISFTAVVAEPLVFFRNTTSPFSLLINPDLWLYFRLEEKAPGIWWDPPKGIEAIRQQAIEQGKVEIVEIRTEYLSRYLQARQMALLIEHIRRLQLYNPTQDMIGRFEEGAEMLGSPAQGVKALVDSDHRDDIPRTGPFLLRKLRLWFEIKPPAIIDIEDPWAEEPPFDVYKFTLPTNEGPVAPARFSHLRRIEGRKFDGARCEYMEPVFFRQEVLEKYQGASGFDVGDDGSVSCRGEWALTHGIWRLGNELLATAIGDFAESIPFYEWPHWQQYAAKPPSPETVDVLKQELKIPDAVNTLVQELGGLDRAFAGLAASLGINIQEPLWSGSLDSEAGRQLKWVYPTSADDSEFLKRATLASALVIDVLNEKLLRKLLQSLDRTLHQNNDDPPQTLRSRRLLQRVTLVAVLIENLGPNLAEIPILVRQAEGEAASTEDDLQVELEKLYERVRDAFAPLAFLYEMRIHGGLAHAPNKKKAAKAAVDLGLPGSGWHRTHYLRLLNLVTGSVSQISEHLRSCAS